MDFTNLTAEQILSLAQPDPELTELLKTQPAPRYDYSDPHRLIVNLREALKQWHTPPVPGVDEKDVCFPARDGYSTRLKVFTPSEAPPPDSTKEATTTTATARPVIVLYHGGGFSIGSPESLSPICRVLVQIFNAMCIAPSYRQGPEDPFPTGILDSWDGWNHIAANLSSFVGAGPASSASPAMIVGGVSAGGKIATVVAHLARDHAIAPPITGVWLAASACVYPESVPDRYRHLYLARGQDAVLNAPVTDTRLSKIFDDVFRPDKASELSSPLNWSTGHTGIPRTFLQVCGTDIVRDDSLIYEKVLREEAGVRTRLNVYPSWPHIFFQIFQDAAATKRFWADGMKGFAWLMEEDKARGEE